MTDESLTSFIEEVCGDSHLRVEDDYGDGFVRLRSAEAERRQAKHDIRSVEDVVIEMLRNARDAGARNLFIATTREGGTRRLVIVDDGQGIPASMHEKVFEPRVTSKLDTMHVDNWGVHGRGMALYSIKANSLSAYVVSSAPGLGSALAVEVDLETLPEKTDQSTWPHLYRDEEAGFRFTGPKNIIRTASEFALVHKEGMNLYLGSATEVVATLYAYGKATLPAATKAFCPNPEDLPLVKRLAITADPESLAALAARMGLSISERSARRVIDGDIAALDTLDEIVSEGLEGASEPEAKSKRKGARKQDDRGLRIDPGDLDAFTNDLQKAFDDLARGYYLETGIRPSVKVSRDSIQVVFPTNKLR